jgi:hypothetical protein
MRLLLLLNLLLLCLDWRWPAVLLLVLLLGLLRLLAGAGKVLQHGCHLLQCLPHALCALTLMPAGCAQNARQF